MGRNDHMDDDGYSVFLREIVESEELDETAKGITMLVIDKGEEALSEKQRHVFEKHVIDEYVTKEFTRGGCEIPWCEMYEAHTNGGLCSWCAKMESNDD